MRRLLGTALLGGLGLLAVEGAALAATAQMPLGCEITRDQGWGEFYFRNLGQVTVPEGSAVDWRTSSGKAGRVTLDLQIAPGQRRYINSVFLYQFGVDDGATCTALVASHPPTLGDQLKVQSQSGLEQVFAEPVTKNKVLALPCKYCDSQVLTAGKGAAASAALLTPQAITSGPSAVLLTPKAVTSDQSASLPATQRFEPPKAAGGQPLYACQSVDSDVCGQPVADKFCQQQGYARAGGYNTEKRKGAAVTLSGETCDKKKCKVFDLIVCTR